jgi:uncharacterized Zn-finger protein
MSGFVRDGNLYGHLVSDVSVTAVGHLVACRQSAVGRRAVSSRVSQVQCPGSKLHPHLVLLLPPSSSRIVVPV